MSSAAQVLRQADALKATISDSSKGLSETWVVRQRLEDLYKKLLLMDLEYALDKKVEQDLWNYAFKNHINNLQTQTKDKQNLKRGETQATLNLFLETASGFYLQLLQLICTSFKLDLPFRRKSSCYGVMKEKIPLKVKIIPPKKSSCLYVCQYCLVHLGDIARYRQQIEQSQTYYWHAANLVPFNGQPYNQLAIVEAARGNKLSTVFYYIRSLAVRHPFPAAATNLEKLYTKLAKDKNEFKGKLSVTEMITAFLQFQAYTHICTELERASMLSSKLLAALPAHVTSQSFPSHILVQIVAINIFAMQHSLRQLHDTDDKQPPVVHHEDLSSDEQQAFSQMFNFTMSVLDVLLQYTPKQEQKLKEFFTLPAVKLLLDWIKLNPNHLQNPSLKSSSLWGNLSKVLNNIKLPSTNKEGNIGLDITKYDDLPLPEDTELRCFQFLEKAHSGYSYSRLPSEGLSSEVETQLRCKRLLMHGKWIAEEHTSKNILNVKTDKSGKMQFSAPSVQAKVISVDESQTPVTEKKSSRQNVAIQAIIQKKNQQQSSSAERATPTKIQERVKPTPVSSESSLTKSITPESLGPTSPKYLLGVPTSEPVFMKAGSTRPQSQGSTRIPIQQQPPRLQKQLLAQQQAAQASSGQQPTLWQENSPPASHTVQSQNALQGPPHQSSQSKQGSQKLLWPQSLQQQQEIKLQQQQQQQNGPKQPQQMSHQSVQNNNSQGHQQQLSPQQPSQGQEVGQISSVTQSQSQIPQPPPPYMVMPPDFRMPSKFPDMSQPPPGMGQSPQMMGYNTRQGPTQGQMGMQGNAGLNSLFRFPPPLGNNTKQSPRIPFDRPPPSMPQQQTDNEASPEVLQENMDMKKQQQQMRGNNSGITYPGFLPNQSYGPQSSSNSLHTQNQQMPQQPKQQQGQGVTNLGNKFARTPNGNQVYGNQGNQYSPGNQGVGQFQGGQGNFSVNNSYPGSQGNNQFPGNQSSNQGNRNQYLSNQHNFQPAPGTDRVQMAGMKQQSPQQGAHPQMQNGSFQNPMMNPMAPMPPGVGRFNLRHPGFGGPVDQNMLKKEDFPMDILGALAQLAVQPPKSAPDNFLLPNRMGTTFQGHAEGTPKPDTGSSPNRSPLPPAEPEVRSTTRTLPSSMQQGTYSLFSGSPWSVPLSTADSKSIGSSPFSSESNSIRNSPDPALDNSETKIGSALDLGLRFGQNEDHWREKGHPPPNQEQMLNPGPGPYFPGPLQAIWSSPGPSPLERLLEMQKQQRQTDPH